jgi:hypothetical protein
MPALIAFSLAVLCLGGCGGPASESPLTGSPTAPRWRLAEGADRQRAGAVIHSASPLRVRLRVEASGAPSEAGAWRPLVAGQSVVVWWSYQRTPRERQGEAAPPSLAKEGRTTAFSALVDYHFDDRVGNNRRLAYWARPGMGKLQHQSALPPGRYEALPREGSIELLTVAMSDLSSGELELKRRELQTRVLQPAALEPGDRVEIVRVFLDLAPLEDS